MANKSIAVDKPQSQMFKPRNSAKQSRAELELSEEARELADAQRRIDDRNRASVDRITKLIGSQTYVIDALPTQVIARELLQKREYAKPGYLENIPKWRFSRYYISEKIVVDLFTTDKAFKEADIEARRAWCHAEGLKYGALGPTNNTTDLVPQLDVELPKAKETADAKKDKKTARRR